MSRSVRALLLVLRLLRYYSVEGREDGDDEVRVKLASLISLYLVKNRRA